MIFAVSGKGGTGKTTLASLIVGNLKSRGQTPILAIDADPNSNLGDKLGLTVDITIGDLREDTQELKYEGPAGVPKQRLVESSLQKAIVEGIGFDLLAMGRGEGPGCYCSVNNMLRASMQELARSYRHIVIDNEAGMEHLSRRTNSKVDLMMIVCDETSTGLKSAERIAELARKLDVVDGEMKLVVNRATDSESAQRCASIVGIELLGFVPNDGMVMDFEINGRPLVGLPNNSGAVESVDKMLDSLEL